MPLLEKDGVARRAGPTGEGREVGERAGGLGLRAPGLEHLDERAHLLEGLDGAGPHLREGPRTCRLVARERGGLGLQGDGAEVSGDRVVQLARHVLTLPLHGQLLARAGGRGHGVGPLGLGRTEPVGEAQVTGPEHWKPEGHSGEQCRAEGRAQARAAQGRPAHGGRAQSSGEGARPAGPAGPGHQHKAEEQLKQEHEDPNAETEGGAAERRGGDENERGGRGAVAQGRAGEAWQGRGEAPPRQRRVGRVQPRELRQAHGAGGARREQREVGARERHVAARRRPPRSLHGSHSTEPASEPPGTKGGGAPPPPGRGAVGPNRRG
nr:hypothetical protein [Galactobacter valiniphilus]